MGRVANDAGVAAGRLASGDGGEFGQAVGADEELGEAEVGIVEGGEFEGISEGVGAGGEEDGVEVGVGEELADEEGEMLEGLARAGQIVDG